ncbi:MAG: ABC transporter permease subunit, partial [Gammaproteobacteria bacterium]|nr:ABC transporter permease subunit [Gammaproteobacteria bacterium]
MTVTAVSDFHPGADDFTRVETDLSVEQISRPSLSYWQDAWVRLKKNTRATISLYIIIGLAIFTLLGPVFWQVDPSLQDLNQISQAPSLPKIAILVGAYKRWDGIVLQDFPVEPEEYAESVAAVTGLRTFEAATTQQVRLIWDPVVGAGGYNIYRNQRAPEGFNDLGLPLGSTYGGNEVSYEDRLSLESRAYYYSIVPTDGYDEYEVYTVTEIKPRMIITVSDAKDRDLISKIEDDNLGQEIGLEFHPFGTDYLGRDMLARLMQGARVSLFIGIVAPFIYVIFGIIYGGFAGYFGGKLDALFMRFADFVVALPFLLFMILFKIAFGIGPGESGIFPMLIALILLLWPTTARLVRGQVLQIREQG